MNSRLIMARVVQAVIKDGATLDDSLNTQLTRHANAKDNGFIQEVCYGVVRHYQALDQRLNVFLDKPLKAKDADIHALILCGLYQLHYLSTADHAAVDETVKAAKQLKKSWAMALVNAVLRRSIRECAHPDKSSHHDSSVAYLHPKWMIDQIRMDWPEHWRQILSGNNKRPPQHLRVNLKQISRQDYLEKLHIAGLAARTLSHNEAALELLNPTAVTHLPDFASGACTIQDAGAQYAAIILAAAPGERILDGCAAPGGKTSHLWEHSNGLAELVALDVTPKRCALLTATLKRTQTHAKVICADIRATEQWWDSRPFDRILLDVPCSATGVIRRHPDIKLLRTQEQLDALHEKQLSILRSAWSVLQVGGTLLYASCSIFKRENDTLISEFLHTQADAETRKIKMNTGIASQHGKLLLPGVHDTDGFYYCLLNKTVK